jgi:phenylalanyl-tRNA synthetase alpha chain
MNDLSVLVEEAIRHFGSCSSSADLENAKAQYLGKTGKITALLKSLAHLNVDEKKSQGALINQAKHQIESALQARRDELSQADLERRLNIESLDVSLPGRKRILGGLHPVSITLSRIEAIFRSMGFDVAQGPEIETDWFNFTALNTPADHPARSMHDTFYVEGGHLLRTHTSPMQIRYAMAHVQSHQEMIRRGQRIPEIRVIAPGRTYRVDSDATHSPMFHQCEGLWLGEGISFKDLKVVFTEFCKSFFESDDLKIRFRPSFFPFTEPSAEVDIQFSNGPLAGKWLEVAGSGQVHPQVVRNMGLDPEQYIGFAFGMGPDRLTMLRYGVNDLRQFFDGDMRFLCQFNRMH